MKKLLTILCIFSFCFFFGFADSMNANNSIQKRGRYQTRKKSTRKVRRVSSGSSSRNGNYIRGPRGGCYYLNRNGNKTYVDRNLCN